MAGRSGQRQFGSIRKLPSGRWQARYKDRSGKVHPRTFDSKGDASAFLAEMETDIRRGTWRNPRAGQMLFQDHAQDWLASDSNKAASTLARDRVVLTRHLIPALGRMQLAEILPDDVQAVISQMERTLRPKTVRTNAGVLAAVLNYAVLRDRLYASPYRRPRLPALEDEDRIRLTLGEQKLLANAMEPDFRVTVFLAGVMGLRFSEMVGLRVQDIDFLRRPVVLTVRNPIVEVEGRQVTSRGKTRGSRASLTVPSFLAEMVSGHLARTCRNNPDELILQAPNGGPLRASNFRQRIWAPAVRASGFQGLTYHGLRHSAAGVMRQAGASDQVVQHRLRHTYRATTSDIYGWTPDAMDLHLLDAVEAIWASEDGTKMARRANSDGNTGA